MHLLALFNNNKVMSQFHSRLTSIISIALVLFLLGLVFLIGLLGNKLSIYVKENISFSIVLKDNQKEADIKKMQKTLDAYAPNDWNKSVKDLGYNIETTSRTYLISCPSADRAHLLLLYSNGKVEKITL